VGVAVIGGGGKSGSLVGGRAAGGGRPAGGGGADAALGAEGLAADVTMLIGNGYVPGHAELALDLVRTDPGVRALFDARLGAD
jgi:hypothetical protein